MKKIRSQAAFPLHLGSSLQYPEARCLAFLAAKLPDTPTNRGNGGTIVLRKDADYAAFLALLQTAKSKYPVRVLGFCLMPNHFHLVVQPATEVALSPFMQWWMTSHVRRYHRHYRSHGHIWQGRFKSFPIQQDAHLLTVLRYVVRNPVRAQLVESVTQWPWSSLHFID